MAGPLERAFARGQQLRLERQAQSNPSHSLSAEMMTATTARARNDIAAFETYFSSHSNTEPDVNIQPPNAQTSNAGSPAVPCTDESHTNLGVITSQIKKRRLVHVNSLGERAKATRWMIEFAQEHGDKYIASKCVKRFPEYFPGNVKANIQKASRWWKSRETTTNLSIPQKRMGSFSFSSTRSRKRSNLKALGGRGRKRAEWVTALYEDLRIDFERLRSAGVKFDTSMLLTHAVMMIIEAESGSLYHESVVYKGKPIAQYVKMRWVQHFMSVNRIVLRAQTGKLMVSKNKQEYIDKTVAYHMGQLKRMFEEGEIHEDDCENADETHFVFNMDNGRTLGFIGDNDVKYADVVSGGEPITMVVRLTGGVNASIQPTMLIFKNQARSYPIRGVVDDVPGVSYRSSPKGWMDSRVWPEYISSLKKKGVRSRQLFVDNCSSHVEDEEVNSRLTSTNTILRKLPANATDIAQACDSFIIQKLKEVWHRKWNEYKYGCIRNGELDTTKSGKIPNPGKRFFLKLAADVTKEVNQMKDRNGISYARKAMMMTGLSLGMDGRWSESQLSDQIQRIIAKHRNHFDGDVVTLEDGNDDSVLEQAS